METGSESKSTNRYTIILAACLLLAIAVRALFLFYPVMDADMAVVGLMGMHALDGDFCAFFWGNDYGGSQEALVAAVFFYLFGVSRTTLNMAPALISLAFLIGLYLTGKQAFNRRTALVALFLAALGPYYLTWHSVLARGIYIFTITCGVWLMWATLRTLETKPGSKEQRLWCLLAGFLMGLGMWSHTLMLYFALPCGLLLWRADPRLPIRGAFLLLLAGFFTGSAPFWHYNIVHGWGTYYYMVQPKPFFEIRETIKFLYEMGFPVLLGHRMEGSLDWSVPVLSQAALAVSLVGIFYSLARWGGATITWLRHDERRGESLMILTLASILLIFTLLGIASGKTNRYLFYVYAVLPLALGYAFDHAWRKGGALKIAAVAGLCVVALLYGWTDYITSHVGNRKLKEQYIAETRRDLNIINYFKEKKIRHIYNFNYWLDYKLIFLDKEGVIFIQPDRARYKPYLNAARQDKDTAILVPAQRYGPVMKATLKTLNASYEEDSGLPGYLIFSRIRPPAKTSRLLKPMGISATGNPDKSGSAKALDGNAGTRWSSEGPQRPGQNLILNMGRDIDGVNQVMLLCGMPRDKPLGLTVSGSLDGKAWEKLGSYQRPIQDWIWSPAGTPIFQSSPNWMEMRFKPTRLRYLRLTQTGTSDVWYWSVLDALVGAATDEPYANPKAAAKWIAKRYRGKIPVWTDRSLSAWLPERLTPPAAHNARPAWMREFVDPNFLLPEGKGLTFAIGKGFWPRVKEVLKSCRYNFAALGGHGYMLVQASPPDNPLPGKELKGGIGPDPGERRERAVFDLGSVITAGSLELTGNRHSFLAPWGMRVFTSLDGNKYKEASFEHYLPPRLYWTGIMPMAAAPFPLRIKLTGPTKVRYVKLVNLAPGQNRYSGSLRMKAFAPEKGK